MKTFQTWIPFWMVLILLLWQPFAYGLDTNPCKGVRHGMVAHPERCEAFIECYAGLAYQKPCSLGLHFNPSIKACDYPGKSKCTASNANEVPEHPDKSDDQPRITSVEAESESKESETIQQGESKDFRSAPLSTRTENSQDKDEGKQMDYHGRTPTSMYRNHHQHHQLPPRYLVQQSRPHTRVYHPAPNRRSHPTRTHAQPTHNYQSPRPTYPLHPNPTISYPSNRPQYANTFVRSRPTVHTTRVNYGTVPPNQINYLHNQRNPHGRQITYPNTNYRSGGNQNGLRTLGYQTRAPPIYGNGKKQPGTYFGGANQANFGRVNPTNYGPSPTATSYQPSYQTSHEGPRSTMPSYSRGKQISSEYPTFSYEAPARERNEFYPSSSSSSGSYPGPRSYPSPPHSTPPPPPRSYAKEKEYFAPQEPKYHNSNLRPSPKRYPGSTKAPSTSSYPSDGYGKEPSYGKSPDGYDYPEPWSGGQDYGDGQQDQYQPETQDPIHSPDNVEGNPDGDGEHHGRKPPDFDNFPYGFLPKHLTGPLGDVPKAVPNQQEAEESTDKDLFGDLQSKDSAGADSIQAGTETSSSDSTVDDSNRLKRSANWFAKMLRKVTGKKVRTVEKKTEIDEVIGEIDTPNIPLGTEYVPGGRDRSNTVIGQDADEKSDSDVDNPTAFNPHSFSTRVDLDSMSISGVHGSIVAASGNGSLEDLGYQSAWANAITNASLPEGKELNPSEKKYDESPNRHDNIISEETIEMSEKNSQNDPYSPPPLAAGNIHANRRNTGPRFGPEGREHESRKLRFQARNIDPHIHPRRPPPRIIPQRNQNFSPAHPRRPPKPQRGISRRSTRRPPPLPFDRNQAFGNFIPQTGPLKRNFNRPRSLNPYSPGLGLERHRGEPQIANFHLPTALGTSDPIIHNHNRNPHFGPGNFGSQHQQEPLDNNFHGGQTEGPPFPYPAPPRGSQHGEFFPDGPFTHTPERFPGPGPADRGFGRGDLVPPRGAVDPGFGGARPHPGPDFHLPRPGPLSARDMKSFSSDAMHDAKFAVRDRLRHEADMSHRMEGIVDSQPFRYVNAFMNAKPYAKYLSHAASSMLEALKIMKSRHNLNSKQLHQFMEDMPAAEVLKTMDEPVHPDTAFPVPPDIDYCPYPNNYLCDASQLYRTIDGSCNNLGKPLWGRSMLPHRRLLPAFYNDGLEEARQSVVGGPLPGARFVSAHSFRDQDRPSSLHTLLLMIWGQFIDHDMTRTAITKVTKDEHGFGPTEDVKCGFDACQTGLKGQEACWPIPVPRDDEDFHGKQCLKFVRAQEVPALNCKFGPREQLNQVTPWLDASQIYGSTKEEADGLRDYSDPGRGRMAVTLHPHGPFYKPLLPQDDVELCRDVNATIKCFKAGDERVNEQVALTAMHTAWMREHNRVEQGLHEVNPHWAGEKLFQETRRVIGAMVQHIVFNEYLPLILGPKIIKEFDLELATEGYYYGNDQSIDPRASNSFGAAAFRFGHTLIQERFRRSGFAYEPDDGLMLSMAFRRPVHVYDTGRGGVDSLLRGLCDFPAQSFDTFFTKQITRSLFTETPPFGLGMDLLSLNIQRGRDHGIPPYNAMREFCGLRRARDFDDLATEVPNPETRNTLRRIYKHVDDIDLFPGGIAEQTVVGGQVGPTFACVIANEFQASRKGDRFWYENDNDVGFTPAQLQEIRKARLARVLCVNGDTIDVIQPWVLLKPFREVYDLLNNEVYDEDKTGMPYEDFARLYDDNFNARVPCDTLPEPDWSKWRQGPYTG